jgi:hypothetical protein
MVDDLRMSFARGNAEELIECRRPTFVGDAEPFAIGVKHDIHSVGRRNDPLNLVWADMFATVSA